MTWLDIAKRSPDLPPGCVPGPVSICCDAGGEPIFCTGEAQSVAVKKPCGNGCHESQGHSGFMVTIDTRGWPKNDVFELIDKLRGPASPKAPDGACVCKITGPGADGVWPAEALDGTKIKVKRINGDTGLFVQDLFYLVMKVDAGLYVGISSDPAR